MNLPNKISISRLVLIPVYILLFYFARIPEQKYILAGLFALMAFTDFLDGWIARKTNTVTKLGALLDPIADKLISLTIIIFYIGNGIPAWMAFLLLGRDTLILALRSFATEFRVTISVSWWGKTKTFFEMIAFFLIILDFTIGTWLLGVAAILSLFSGFDYVRQAIIKFKEKNVLKHFK